MFIYIYENVCKINKYGFNTKLDNPFIVKLLNKLKCMNYSRNVIFCWIPSHIRIQGNDQADSLAKAALNIKKVKLATIVEGDPKAPFSIATTPRCRGGRYSIPRIAPLYP